MKPFLDFKVKDYQTENASRLKADYNTIRILIASGYNIQVDNSSANSFNTNIDSPVFFCFAINEAEAVGQMILSDWEYKHLKITKISID